MITFLHIKCRFQIITIAYCCTFLVPIKNQYPPKFLSHNIYAQGLIFLPGQFNTTEDWLTIYQVNLHGPRNKNILVQWFRGGNLNHSGGSGPTTGLMIYIQFDAPWHKEQDISGLGVGILKMFSRYLVISCSKAVKITPGDHDPHSIWCTMTQGIRIYLV